MSEIIESQKNIEMQTILSISTPTIDIEPAFESNKNSTEILKICGNWFKTGGVAPV